jgi:hypothetical protein
MSEQSDELLEYQIERTATIVWDLSQGKKYTTRQIMAMTGLSRQGVWYHMGCIMRTRVPITQVDGFWQRMTETDADRYIQEHFPSSDT